MSKDNLNEALRQMQNQAGAEARETASIEAVWDRLQNQQPLRRGSQNACDTMRPQLADFVAGRLEGARRELLADHLSRCAGCRNSMAELRGANKTVSIDAGMSRRRFGHATKWAAAAAVAVVAVFASRDNIDSWLAPGGPRATVVAVAGQLYRIASDQSVVLAAGAEVAEGELLRTGKDTRVVLRLADGSKVEMNERSELSLESRYSGQRIRLERGDVMVEAAKQKRGDLQVVTKDSVVRVKGTIFAVRSGTQGSLVTVVEGSVQVDQNGGDQLLKPGQQAASTQALQQVPAREAIAWSAKSEEYVSLLNALSDIERAVASRMPGLRYESRLLNYMPENIDGWVAMPNLGGVIGEVTRLMDERSRSNAAVNRWWNADSLRQPREILQKLELAQSHMGEEIVFTMVRQREGNSYASEPLFLTQAPAGREEAARQQVEALVRGADGANVNATLQDGVIVISLGDSPMIAPLRGGANSRFANAIRERYARGAGWLAALSLQQAGGDESFREFSGLSKLDYIFVEQRTSSSVDESNLTFAFNGERKGLASWLAQPGSTGSANYISGSAIFAASVSVRNPQQMFDELIERLGAMNPETLRQLRELEAKAGINFSADIASAFGSDASFAIEAMTVPVPTWIAAVEVYNASNIDRALRLLVDAARREMPNASHLPTWRQEVLNGRTWGELSLGGTAAAIHYTVDRGYLVAGSDRGAVNRAIQTRDGGMTLTQSTLFRSRLPQSDSAHQSGFFWVNPTAQVQEMAKAMSGKSSPIPGLTQFLQSREPVLISLQAKAEQIVVASRTRITSVLLDAMMLSAASTEKQ
jgi:hypothetical protein